MAIDTPARLAILGAGPVGIEAALYARFLGYDVDLYERGEPGENVRRQGHVRLFSPFGLNRSNLGLRALAAQDESYRPPADDDCLTGDEWRDRYLLPLARTDLIVDSLKAGVTVVSVARAGLLKGEMWGDDDRGDFPFRLLMRDANGEFRVAEADGVIDATGVLGNPNFLGEAGQAAVGELVANADSTRAARDPRIAYRIPDVLGAERDDYAGQHTVLIGAGHSAATTIVALAQLAASAPGTRVTWLTRNLLEDGQDGPVEPIADDPWPARRQCVAAANRLAREGEGGSVTHWAGTSVHAMRRVGGDSRWELDLLGIHAGQLPCDRVIANVGYRPDTDLFRELHVAVDGRDEGTGTLVTPEPNYYVLGAKSGGRATRLTFQDGLDQIRELFRILGDRQTLDLYAATTPLPR